MPAATPPATKGLAPRNWWAARPIPVCRSHTLWRLWKRFYGGPSYWSVQPVRGWWCVSPSGILPG